MPVKGPFLLKMALTLSKWTLIIKVLIAPQQRFELPTLRSIALMNSDSEFHGSEFQGVLISAS